jgi:hypothetical protein
MKTTGGECHVKIIFHKFFWEIEPAFDVMALILRSNTSKATRSTIRAFAKIIVAQIHPDSIALYNSGYD